MKAGSIVRWTKFDDALILVMIVTKVSENYVTGTLTTTDREGDLVGVSAHAVIDKEEVAELRDVVEVPSPQGCI